MNAYHPDVKRSRQPLHSTAFPLGLASLVFMLMVQPAVAGQQWQQTFDAVPASLATSNTTVHQFILPDGRVLPYGSFGPAGGEPVLFIPGTPSGVYGSAFLEGHRTSFEQKRLRLIVPERPGYGQMPIDFTATISSQVDDWAALMNHLDYDEYKLFAVSGGGPFADNMLTRYEDRITIAVVAAGIQAGPGSATLAQPQWVGPCQAPFPQALVGAFLPTFQFLQANPQFYFPPGRQTDIIQSIPGLPDLAVVQHDFYTIFTQNPPDGTDAGLALEIYNHCNEDPSSYNFASATMPVYLYSAANDINVLQADSDWRESVFPNAVHRRYDNDTHIAWLRHLGQVILDLDGNGDRTLLCLDRQKAMSLPEDSPRVERLLERGWATLDICAWSGTSGRITESTRFQR